MPTPDKNIFDGKLWLVIIGVAASIIMLTMLHSLVTPSDEIELLPEPEKPNPEPARVPEKPAAEDTPTSEVSEE